MRYRAGVHAACSTLRIVEVRRTGARSPQLLSASRVRDVRPSGGRRRSSTRVRRGGDRALRRFARELRRARRAAIEDAARGVGDARARRCSRGVRGAIASAARHIRRVARAQVPKALAATRRARRHRRAARRCRSTRVGCYVPAGRYPLPSSLLMTAIPARVAGVDEVDRRCARGRDAAVFAAAIEAGVDRFFQHRRRARDRGHGLRHAHGAARGQDRRARQPLGGGGQVARAPRLRDRFLRRPDRDSDRRRRTARRLDCRRSDRAGRTRSRRARGLDHAKPRGWPSASRGSRAASCPPTDPPRVAGAPWRHHRDARTLDEAIALANDSALRAPRGREPTRWRARMHMPGRCSSAAGRRRSPATTPSDRITCCRPPAPRASAAA